VARQLHAASDELGQVQLAVDLAVQLIGGCDHAGVSIVEGRSIHTPVGSDDVVCRGDALQCELDEGRQRSVAMTNRTVIGQAEGIVMERLGLDADQAFACLRRMSQTENRKLVTICNQIVETRQLPA
jgi:hypothetical protein